jgi:hypothetical protein
LNRKPGIFVPKNAGLQSGLLFVLLVTVNGRIPTLFAEIANRRLFSLLSLFSPWLVSFDWQSSENLARFVSERQIAGIKVVYDRHYVGTSLFLAMTQLSFRLHNRTASISC